MNKVKENSVSDKSEGSGVDVYKPVKGKLGTISREAAASIAVGMTRAYLEQENEECGGPRYSLTDDDGQ